MLVWGGFELVWKRVDVNNERLKSICRINWRSEHFTQVTNHLTPLCLSCLLLDTMLPILNSAFLTTWWNLDLVFIFFLFCELWKDYFLVRMESFFVCFFSLFYCIVRNISSLLVLGIGCWHCAFICIWLY